MDSDELEKLLPVWVKLYDGVDICLVQKIDETAFWGTCQPNCWTQKKYRVRTTEVRRALMADKTLNVVDNTDLKTRIEDSEIHGVAEWVLLCKASSESQGWMKSTKALPIENVGCLVQVTTQQKNPDGSYSLAEALTFVPDVEIGECVGGIGLFEIEDEDDVDDVDDVNDVDDVDDVDDANEDDDKDDH